MRPTLALLLACVLLACSHTPAANETAEHSQQQPEEPPPMPTDMLTEPGARFDGRISLGATVPGGSVAAFEGLVIDNPADYAAFIQRIPTHAIQKKQPAPPSDDPLLAQPPINFGQHLLIVAIRGDSMYVGPRIGDPEPTQDGGTLYPVTLPSTADTAMLAARGDIGTYQALIIERTDGVQLALDTSNAGPGSSGGIELTAVLSFCTEAACSPDDPCCNACGVGGWIAEGYNAVVGDGVDPLPAGGYNNCSERDDGKRLMVEGEVSGDVFVIARWWLE